jgi:predicted O-methyltransferase YrrM
MGLRLLSGLPAVDAYLDEGFEEVRGMSSRFATAIGARIIAIQREAGIGGGVAEIGAFMGRFFIAMAKALETPEIAIGVDHFEWPSPDVLRRFEENCDRHGLDRSRRVTLKRDSRAMQPSELTGPGRGPLRFIHVDSEHDDATLSSDLALALASLAPRGLMLLDDMLHPGYPLLALTVARFLDAHPDLRVIAVIDREDIVGAAKFLIGREADHMFYQKLIWEAFPRHVWPMRAEFGSHESIVLTPEPKLAAID